MFHGSLYNFFQERTSTANKQCIHSFAPRRCHHHHQPSFTIEQFISDSNHTVIKNEGDVHIQNTNIHTKFLLLFSSHVNDAS